MTTEYRSGLLWPNSEIGGHFTDLYGSFWCSGELTHQLKEAVRVRNARITDCGYWKNVRFSLAREAGFDETEVELINGDWDASPLPADWVAALKFTDHFIMTPGPTPRHLRDTLINSFTNSQLAELAIGVGLFHGFSKMLIGLGREPEEMETTIIH